MGNATAKVGCDFEHNWEEFLQRCASALLRATDSRRDAEAQRISFAIIFQFSQNI